MSPMHRVLVVDEASEVRALVEITLGRMRLHTQSARTLHEARIHLARERFDLCLTDLHLPDGSGLDLLLHIRQCHPKLPVALLSNEPGTQASALEAGACDLLHKPLHPVRLREWINSRLKRLPSRTKNLPAHQLLGDSPPMDTLRRHIDKLATSLAAVYISGESGSGKERVAHLIHQLGPRAREPFIPVNCGAIPGELMESEFFGHRKGSFSGALTDQPGLFQAAQGGTLFLDEVADLPLAMQVKLLRALQEKSVRPVGSQEERAVDVRILCATHKDLKCEVESGRFRQDLYYRLNVIELRVPALRERPGDIGMLARHILQRLAEAGDKPATQLHPQALQALERYDFPGNVRELENLLERAQTLCEGPWIELADLHLPVSENQVPPSHSLIPSLDLTLHLQQVERHLLLQALEESRWNRTAAARRLSLSLRSMRYRMKKLGLD
ncbi:sigma-54-dependent Fis family transcriptional regulator [Pseudomonas protegens]|uniref:sigma-54-dependent transcriptional regulator n=1 Tax=Pseudomonas protegens TaxID=380021 RepID=UPI000F4C0A8E|nr:sigma-54 dependent transcriptional regulator [Pseudomonas protegens]ROL80659.1 sigma-54-dependent Fis family transcriptional regulator [Pseudomonas protegens]